MLAFILAVILMLGVIILTQMSFQSRESRSNVDPQEEQPIIEPQQQQPSPVQIKNNQILPYYDPVVASNREVLTIRPEYDEDRLLFKGNNQKDDLEIIGVLDSRAPELEKWMLDFQTKHNPGEITATGAKQLNMDSTYAGIMFFRRIARVLIHFIFLGIVAAFFAWGYFVSLEEGTWISITNPTSYDITCKNCWINIYESEGSTNFTYRALGALNKHVNASLDYVVTAKESETETQFNFTNPFNDIKYLIVDLYLPKTLTNLKYNCINETKCIVVINHEKLEVTELASFTAGWKSDLQLNVKNLQTKTFNFLSESGGALYLNHILATEASIKLLSGPIVIQSTESMGITLSSYEHAFCMSGPSVTANQLQTCYMDEATYDFYWPNYCDAQVDLCTGSSCSPTQDFTVIANSSTIYANILKDIGKPYLREESIDILKTGIFNSGTVKFDEASKAQIMDAVNKTVANADKTIRINMGGSHLLQQTSNTYWSFFSNEAYAAFDPWWLSVLSASFLGSQFFEIDTQLQPGFCPYYPVVNQTEVYMTKQLIDGLLYTDGSATVYQSKDNRPLPPLDLNSSETYSGVEELLRKPKNQVEAWYKLKINSDSISLETLPYDVFFMVAIGLSILSALIFAFVATTILIVFMYKLETYVMDQATSFQNYSSTTSGQAMDSLTEVMKKMLAKKDLLNSQKSPPMIYGVISYCLYVFAQTSFKNSAKVFCKTIFKKSNEVQTALYYKGQLEQKYLSIDEKELKEIYEQLCYLNRLTVIPLNQEEALLESYGFALEEKGEACLFLSKIKLRPDRKPFHLLKPEEKNSENSLELFMATQVLLTGIAADMVAFDILEEEYNKFCGRVLQKDQINSKDLATDYGLAISDMKNFELRKIKSFAQKVQSWHTRFLGRCTHYIPFIENYHTEEPVYIIRKNTSILSFQQNPYKTLKEGNLKWWSYNFVRMVIESLRFNYKTRLFSKEYSYRDVEDNNIAMDYFDAVYMSGWLWSEIIIVIGNMIVTGLAVMPILFFLMLVNVSYAPFALYDPRSLMFTQDILVRPWSVFKYRYSVDEWVLAISILVLYYGASSFLFQTIKYLFSYFPDEIGYMYEYRAYENKILKYVNWFQWIQFIILFFCVFCYFGVIIVWLILGAIINPNNYLVYTSSALTLVITILAEYQSIQATYDEGCLAVKKLIGEMYLKTFGMVGGALIKEIQKLSDKSVGIINSSGMTQAQDMAEQLGFGEELNELCIMTQQMLENGNPASLDVDTLSFKKIKDKFIESACAKFVKIATEQFNVKPLIAEQLVKSNFFKFEEILDTLANQLQVESENKIPAAVIKWIYGASVSINRVLAKKSAEDRRRDMEILVPKLTLQLLDAVVEGMLIKVNIDDKGMTQQTLKAIVQSINQMIQDKSSTNLLKQMKLLFQGIKDYVAIDSQPILVLEMMFNYAEVLASQPNNLQTIQQDLIKDILAIFNVDSDISFIMQLIFSGGQQTQFKIKDQIIESPSDLAAQVIGFQSKYIPIANEDDQNRFELFTTIALKILRNDKLPNYEILELVLQQIQDPQIQDFLLQLFQDNQQWVNTITTLINLGSKSWKQLSQLTLKGVNFELTLDVMYMSSKYMWTLPYFEKRSEIKQEDNSNESWDAKSWKKPAARIPNRLQKLIDRDLIEHIAEQFQLSEEALIGLVLILRGEITESAYHDAAYKELTKVVAKDMSSDYVQVKRIMEVMSSKDFENVCLQVVKFGNTNIITAFVNLATVNARNFVLFGDDAILGSFTNPDKVFEKKYLVPLREKIAGYKKQQLDEADIQFLNTYKSEKFSFYQYLKKSQRDEAANKLEESILKAFKQEMLTQIMQNVKVKLDYLMMIMELQTQLAQPSSAAANINLLNGLKQEPFKHLIYILQFKDAQMLIKGVQFFTSANPQSYKGVDFFEISKALQTFIDAESSILTIQIPNTVPYQVQHLLPLLINNMVNTRIPISATAFRQWIRTFNSQYPLPEELIEFKQYATTVEKFTGILYPSPQRHAKILEVINVLSGPNKLNNKLQDFIVAVLDKDFNKLMRYLVVYFQSTEPAKYRKFFQKVTFITQGFSSTQASDIGDSDSSNIVWANQQLKYFLSYDVNGFIELIENFFVRILGDKPDMNQIRTLLSIFTDKQDYPGLSALYGLNEEMMRLAQLMVEAMVSNNKSQLLLKIQSSGQLMNLVATKLQIKDLQPLQDLSDVLEQNILDIPRLLRNLKLSTNATATKLYSAFFSFNWQLKSTDSYAVNLQQYKSLAILRSEIFKADKLTLPPQKPDEISNQDTLEVLHWFSSPKPLNYLYKLASVPLMRPQESAAMIFSAIGSIAKYDQLQTYKLRQPEQLKYVMNKVNTLANKSVERALMFIAESSDQDLTESFHILNLVCGVNPLFASAIINQDKNECMQEILAAESTKNRDIIQSLFLKLDSYQTLDAFWRFYLIESETLQNATQTDNAGKDVLIQMVKQSQTIFNNKLKLSTEDRTIIEEFILDQAQGDLQQHFPLSTLVLLFALRHLRQCAQTKSMNSVEKFLKATHLIDLALTVIEKYMYFYDQEGLQDFNKPFMVRMITLSIFDTPSLRCFPTIDQMVIEKMLYPGMSDLLLIKKYYKDAPNPEIAKFGYQQKLGGKPDNLKELSKVIIETQTDYQNIFIPLISKGDEKIDYKGYQPNVDGIAYDLQTKWFVYNSANSQLFLQTGEVTAPNLMLMNAPSLEKLYESQLQDIKALIGGQAPQIYNMLQLQAQYVLKIMKCNIAQARLFKTKYISKSLDLLKKYVLKPSEEDILSSDISSEGQDQTAISLMRYYQGQASLVQTTEATQEPSQKAQVAIQIDQSSPYIQFVLSGVAQVKAKQGYRGKKSKKPINSAQFIDSVLAINLNEEERSQLRFIVNIMYNPKQVQTADLEQFWGVDTVVMNAVMMMILRMQLEYSKQEGKFAQLASKLPQCYLYQSLGDKYEEDATNKDQKQNYQQNNVALNQGMDKLISNCSALQDKLRSPLKLMLRCYMGDIEAWYTLIAFVRNKLIQKSSKLSEQMIHTFIVNFLLQLKNMGLRSHKTQRIHLVSQSLLEFLKGQPNFNLKRLMETVLIETFEKNGQEFPEEVSSKFTDFLDFIVDGKIQLIKNSFMDVLQCMLRIESRDWRPLSKAAKILLQILFKGEQSNENFIEYENDLGIQQWDGDKKKSWELFKIFLEIQHSNDLKVAIFKVSELMKDNKHYKKYTNLFVSINAIQYIKFLPALAKGKLDEGQVMEVLLYPVAWIGNMIAEKYAQSGQQTAPEVSQFLEFSTNLINNQANPINFKTMLDVISTIEQQSQDSEQQLVSQDNITYFVNAFKTYGQANKQSGYEAAYQVAEKLLNYSKQPPLIQLLIQSFCTLLYGQSEDTKLKMNQLLEKFITELANHASLAEHKDIIKASIVGLQKIKDPKQLKEDDFLKVIVSLLSKYPKVQELAIILLNVYKTGKFEDLKGLPKTAVSICCGDQYKDQMNKVPLDSIFNIANNTIALFQQIEQLSGNQMDESELLKLCKPILEPMFGATPDGQKDLNMLMKCLEAFIALKQKRYVAINTEFFQIMKISPQNSQLIVKMMSDFQVALKSPQNLIKEKMQSFVNPNIVRSMQYVQNVSAKLQDCKDLQYEDMFRVLDKEGKRIVPAQALLEFLRRINIQITDHKYREVLVVVKECQIQIETASIDFEEFKEIMNQISGQTMFLALEYLGISRDLLMKGLVLLIVYLILVIAFILIGVQAFAIPGTFASIINSILPMLGGFGLNKQAAEDRLKAFNLHKLHEIVKRAVRVIQSCRI